jgi:hypothetical protein
LLIVFPYNLSNNVILSEAKDLWIPLEQLSQGNNPRCFASLNMTTIIHEMLLG